MKAALTKKLNIQSVNGLKIGIQGFGKVGYYLCSHLKNEGAQIYGYDVNEDNYLIPCEKDQKIIREMKYLKDSGNSYQKVSEIITAKTKKKFATSWVWAILKREGVSA